MSTTTPLSAFTLRGHWLYVKKCLQSDIVDPATGKTLIVLPEKSKDFPEMLYAWFEVVAKGPQVGTRVNENTLYGKERKARGFAMHLPDMLKLGDRFLTRCDPWRMLHSPYAKEGEQFFMDETAPMIACDKHDNVLMLQDYVLLELAPKVHGTIIESDNVLHVTEQATVVAVGPGMIDKNGKPRPLAVHPGDTVIIKDLNEVERQLVIHGKPYRLQKESELLAIIEKEVAA